MSAKAVDISKVDEEGLQAVLDDLDAQMTALRDKKKEIKAERDKRAVMEIAEGLSDSQRETLAQVLTVAPIDSEETVGTPA